MGNRERGGWTPRRLRIANTGRDTYSLSYPYTYSDAYAHTYTYTYAYAYTFAISYTNGKDIKYDLLLLESEVWPSTRCDAYPDWQCNRCGTVR